MDVVLWQGRIVFVSIEGELQKPCARNLNIVAKILHILSDETEIFGDERQSAQLGFDPAEEPGPRTRLPRPRLGRGNPGRYVPGRRKPAEVVETNQVHMRQKRAKALDAPAVPVLAERIPVVNGIAPQLPLRAEVFGRHASYKLRPAGLVQKKQLRVGPNIAGIGCNEKRQVANERHSLRMRVLFSLLPLPGHQKLLEPEPVDVV